MRKTAEMGMGQHPRAATIIKENSYMDDIIDSVESPDNAKQLTNEIEQLLAVGGFKMKEWIISNDASSDEKALIVKNTTAQTEKVLGVMWSPTNDRFRFKVKLDLSKKNRQITQTSAGELPAALAKRSILSQINRIYDPLGLAIPYTVPAKILMRKLWSGNTKLDWDDLLPNDLVTDWNTFFEELPKTELETLNRCIKPLNTIGDPILITFSDGSENAYGACAYVRWKLSNGTFESRMVISKNRLSPLKKMSVDRIELCGTVLSKRLKVFLDKESRYKFAKYYHIFDSQIVWYDPKGFLRF